MDFVILTPEEVEMIKDRREKINKGVQILKIWDNFINEMKKIDADIVLTVDKYGYKGAGMHQMTKASVDYSNRLVIHMA